MSAYLVLCYPGLFCVKSALNPFNFNISFFIIVGKLSLFLLQLNMKYVKLATLNTRIKFFKYLFTHLYICFALLLYFITSHVILVDISQVNFGWYKPGKLWGTLHKGRNSAVQSSQLSLAGQYKKCVQYDFKFTPVYCDLFYFMFDFLCFPRFYIWFRLFPPILCLISSVSSDFMFDFVFFLQFYIWFRLFPPIFTLIRRHFVWLTKTSYQQNQSKSKPWEF